MDTFSVLEPAAPLQFDLARVLVLADVLQRALAFFGAPPIVETTPEPWTSFVLPAPLTLDKPPPPPPACLAAVQPVCNGCAGGGSAGEANAVMVALNLVALGALLVANVVVVVDVDEIDPTTVVWPRVVLLAAEPLAELCDGNVVTLSGVLSFVVVIVFAVDSLVLATAGGGPVAAGLFAAGRPSEDVR